MATYLSVWSDVLCFRPSPRPLHPSSPIWFQLRLQIATKPAAVRTILMSHYYFLSTEVGDKNNCNSEATEWRLTRASGVTCLFSIHPQTPWHLLAQSHCFRHWKEQRNESRATILMGHKFCQPRWVTKITVTGKRWMATYESVWSDVFCFRPSPRPLHPSSPIWLLFRL